MFEVNGNLFVDRISSEIETSDHDDSGLATLITCCCPSPYASGMWAALLLVVLVFVSCGSDIPHSLDKQRCSRSVGNCE